MNLGVVVIFLLVMVSGFALGMLLGLARPRDEQAAALYRQQARRARAYLPARTRSNHVRREPEPGAAPRR